MGYGYNVIYCIFWGGFGKVIFFQTQKRTPKCIILHGLSHFFELCLTLYFFNFIVPIILINQFSNV